MAQKKRINRSPELKASIVLEVLTGKISVPQAASKYKIKDSVIYGWRNEVVEKLPLLFTTKAASDEDRDAERVDELERLIGQQAVEIDFLKKAGRWLILRLRSGDCRSQATDHKRAGARTRRRGCVVSTARPVREQLLL